MVYVSMSHFIILSNIRFRQQRPTRPSEDDRPLPEPPYCTFAYTTRSEFGSHTYRKSRNYPELVLSLSGKNMTVKSLASLLVWRIVDSSGQRPVSISTLWQEGQNQRRRRRLWKGCRMLGKLLQRTMSYNCTVHYGMYVLDVEDKLIV
jgi:hypothetical protein